MLCFNYSTMENKYKKARYIAEGDASFNQPSTSDHHVNPAKKSIKPVGTQYNKLSLKKPVINTNNMKADDSPEKENFVLSFDVNSYFLNDNISQIESSFNVIKNKKTETLSNMETDMTESCYEEGSEFYDSTQVLRQLESVMESCDEIEMNESSESSGICDTHIFKEPQIPCIVTSTKNSASTSKEVKIFIDKIKQHDDWDDSLNLEISQLFRSSQYKKEISRVFNNLEYSIRDINDGQDETLRNVNNTTLLSRSQTSDMVLDSTDWENDTIANNLTKILSENIPKPMEILNNIEEQRANTDFVSMGPFYGLPDKVRDLIKQYKDITKLYDWQDECLNLDAIKQRKNLVYALPTSGGKTLVSEILVLREVMCRRRNVLFILPYVSIVQEKVWGLSPFALALDFLVEEYAAGKGGYPPRKRRHKRSVYIATIEKALALVNSLMELDRLNELGLVVVDELHLVGEPGRGVVLETLLAKLIYAKENIQIVGMSATIGNLPEICQFLKADVYTQDFRPVELKEYLKCGNEICEINRDAKCEEEYLVPYRTLDFKYSEEINKIDPDKLGGLVMEVVPKDSCLVFCATKKNCENVAKLLCRVMFRSVLDHEKKHKEDLLVGLRGEGAVCPILRQTIPFGVAYHHSGLTADERRLIEDAFRVGTLCVICCTSTLAAGVNLPARRVILRSPYVGRDFIGLAKYKQMIGRAGRAGLGEIGESILVFDPRDHKKVLQLLGSPMEHAQSRLCEDDSKGLRNMILSCIGLGTATTRHALRQVTTCTLLAVQEERLETTVKGSTDLAISELFKMGALQIASEATESSVPDKNISIILQSSIMGNTQGSAEKKSNPERKQIVIGNDSRLVVSKLGKAAIKGGLDLDTAHILFEDLVQAQSSLVLLSDLHLLYLVTPYELARQIQPSLPNYYSIYINLGIQEMQTARILGLNEACCAGMITGRRIKTVDERVMNRFYLTLALHDLWKGNSVFDVSEKYQVSRGIVQQVMVSSATFASNVMRFCEQLPEFWAFVELLRGMGQRLQHCATRELEPLMELPAVKMTRARQLYRAGYKTLQSIARGNPGEIVTAVENISFRVANQLIASAKLLLLERVENLREAAEDLLDDIEIT